MRIEIECCGFNPASIKAVVDVSSAKSSITKNKIVIESPNQPIKCLTIKRRSIYNSRLCYLNMINPVYYLYQYKLKNDDIYFYDSEFLDADIIFNTDTDWKLKLTRERKHINGSSICNYVLTAYNHKKGIRIEYHDMPQIQILRYKRTNIISQLFYAMLISCLAIWQMLVNRKNSLLYLIALIILLVISGVKIFRYYSSKSIKHSSEKML